MKNDASMNFSSRTQQKLARDLGSEFLAAFDDSATVEMMLNADGRLWQERLGEPMRCIGSMGSAKAQAVIETIAGFHKKEVTRSSPLIEGEFPLDGSRFAGQLPPVVLAPTFAVRKKAVAVFTLEDYVAQEIMTRQHFNALVEAVQAHKNILVVGGTGSGKTTLVNAIIGQMVVSNPMERVFILEDTGEIQCSAENFVQYHTSLDVDMTTLLKTTLRMRPDRILVGEVRGAEALDLLDAWNTGHEGGAATLHANSALAGLSRLKSLVTRNKAAPADIEPLIGEVVHLIVHIARTATGRKVKEILQIDGYANGGYTTKLITN
jgi:type IV secretion system protein TrbB